MKKALIYVSIILLTAGTVLYGQRQINMCGGSGEHCMSIVMGEMKITLVKSRNEPEIIIKEK